MTLPVCFAASSDSSVAIVPLDADQLHHWLATQPERVANWVNANGFTAQPDTVCRVPAEDGGMQWILAGVSEMPGIWSLSGLPLQLPAGDYHLDCGWDGMTKQSAALGWALGAYQFSRYKAVTRTLPRLVVDEADQTLLTQVSALYKVRDLINLPPDDMMPPEMASEAKALADRYGARFSQIVGDDLLTENYPAIHAVGRASVHAPRLLKLSWGDASHPRIALVGKGVCFDSGGLDIKPSSGMRYMQKDMGGAAHVIGLAELIMATHLPVCLEVYIPAVENAISGNAFHPGDILDTRCGRSVEIDNTDAEGRLILCDAITAACEQSPEIVIDFATLTGAARVAVGTEIACFFSNRRDTQHQLVGIGEMTDDATWPLPLHQPYRAMLDSEPADIANAGGGGYGGAITAALFLQEFVKEGTEWIHMDMMAWNNRPRPGRPKGGEAMGVRAVFELLRQRYAV